MNYEIKRFENAEETALEFSKTFIDLCNQIAEEKGKVTILLSGGSTPKLFFNKLVSQKEKIADWNKLHFYWGDERCVPPDHSDSNYLMTKENLFDHISIKDENIHRIKGEAESEMEATRYSSEISENVRCVNDLPQFDITILGLGTDGHTASIFPHQMELLTSNKICEVAEHPESGQKRITVTGKVLNNSKNIFFLATGENKATKIREILNREGEYLSYPASFINSSNNKLSFYLDISAAKLL